MQTLRKILAAPFYAIYFIFGIISMGFFSVAFLLEELACAIEGNKKESLDCGDEYDEEY